MRRARTASLVWALTLAILVAVRADDDASTRVLVDKAIAAHGGAANLAKWQAITAKLKGTFHGTGVAIPYSGEIALQGPSQRKLDIEASLGGQTVRMSRVLNGGKGWVKFNDATKELAAHEIAEAKEEARSDWVAAFLPLKNKEFALAVVGEVEIDKRPALGIKASSKDLRDIDLYFDKEAGLLVKAETRVKDDDGQEVAEETFFSDYKEVQGTRQATKFVVKRDGKLYLEGEVSDYQLTEKLDDGVFAKP